MKTVKLWLIFVLLLFVGVAIADKYTDCSIYGTCSLKEKVTSISNYSTINVNNSQYLQGYEPQEVADLYTEIDSLSFHLNGDNSPIRWASNYFNITNRTFIDSTTSPKLLIGYDGVSSPCGASLCINVSESNVGGIDIKSLAFNMFDMKRLSSGSAQFRLIDYSGNVMTTFVSSTTGTLRGPNNGLMALQVGDYAGNVLGVDASNNTWIYRGPLFLDEDNKFFTIGEGLDAGIRFTGSIMEFRDYGTNDNTLWEFKDAPVDIDQNLSVGESIDVGHKVYAVDYITKTNIYNESKGSALNYITADRDKINAISKEIDHSKFYGYEQRKVTTYPYTISYYENVCEITTDKSGEIYNKCEQVRNSKPDYSRPVLTITEGVSLGKEVALLRQAVYEQQLIIDDLKRRIEILEK